MTASRGGPQSWFFIGGCQRSGTTLMRLILECHSQIECVDELYSYRILEGACCALRGRARVGLKVPAVSEQFDAIEMWDPIGVPRFPNPYRRQPIVFMVRHALDTVASMRALRLREGPWLDVYLAPTLRRRRKRDAGFAQRYAAEFERIAGSPHPDLAAAALYWRYKIEALARYEASGLPVLPVRYEDLVTNPGTELARVCAFLGVPWEETLLSHHTRPHTEVDAEGFAMGRTQSARPIVPLSVNRWRHVFSDDEAAAIVDLAGPALDAWYPAVSRTDSG